MERILFVVMLPFAALLLGAVAFLVSAASRAPGTLPVAYPCAAVATGHAARLEAAADLLREGAIARLLISGSVEGADPQLLREIAARAGPRWDCCATTSQGPRNTADNVVDIARWARSQRCEGVLVVTDRLHAARVELVMQRSVPDLPFALHAVDLRARSGMDPSAWVVRGGEEYLKYLATLLGVRGTAHLSAPSPGRPPDPSTPEGQTSSIRTRS